MNLKTQIRPMLASTANTPFSKPGWHFEPKLDGVRAIAYIKNGDVRLFSRRGIEISARYPELTRSLTRSRNKQTSELILDGEIVALDSRGIPSFQLLQRRSGLTEQATVAQAEQDIPVCYYVFDLLYKNGDNLMDLPLSSRQEHLKKVLSETNCIKYVRSLGTSGEEAYAVCIEKGLEGVVAKKLSSRYEPGRRAKTWLKVKASRTDEYLICGYTPGTGSRASTFGALVLGYFDRPNLVYVGLVGTGFTEREQQRLLQLFAPLEISSCPLTANVTAKLQAKWMKPELVAQIKYVEFTNDGKLRSPVFMGLREDVPPLQAGPVPIASPS